MSETELRARGDRTEAPPRGVKGVGGAAAPPTEAKGASPLRELLAVEGVASILAVGVVALVFQLQTSLFLSSTNISNLLVQVVPLVLVGLAQSVVILMREIDLSLGSIVGFCAAAGASLIALSGTVWWLAILAMLACGAAMGGVQGAIVVVGRVPAFVVTLGGYLAFLGLQLDVLGTSGGINVADPHIMDLTTSKLSTAQGLIGSAAVLAAWLAYYAHLVAARRKARRRTRGQTMVDVGKPVALVVTVIGGTLVLNQSGGIPLAFVLTLLVVGLVAAFLGLTATGRHVYAIGGNPEAARRAGVKVQTIRWGGFVVAGILAGCAGLAYLSYDQGAATTTGGGTLLLQAIGAAVIGGVSLFGGRGSAWGALTGALVIGGIENGLNLTNQAAPTKYVIEGVVVVIAVLLDSVLRRGVDFRWSSAKARLSSVGRARSANPGGSRPGR